MLAMTNVATICFTSSHRLARAGDNYSRAVPQEQRHRHGVPLSNTDEIGRCTDDISDKIGHRIVSWSRPPCCVTVHRVSVPAPLTIPVVTSMTLSSMNWLQRASLSALQEPIIVEGHGVLDVTAKQRRHLDGAHRRRQEKHCSDDGTHDELLQHGEALPYRKATSAGAVAPCRRRPVPGNPDLGGLPPPANAPATRHRVGWNHASSAASHAKRFVSLLPAPTAPKPREAVQCHAPVPCGVPTLR